MAKLNPKEEQRLVEAAQKSHAAFGAIYDIYFDAIYRYVYRHINNRETTEDIVSQTFFNALDHIDSFRFQGTPFSSWLYKIAHNNILQHYRSYQGRETIDLDAICELSDPKIDIKNGCISSENCSLVKRLLRKLSSEDSEIIILKFFEELNNQEIAGILKLTPNNIGVKIHRALTKFKKLLEEENVTITY